jgi:hypothetical protein
MARNVIDTTNQNVDKTSSVTLPSDGSIDKETVLDEFQSQVEVITGVDPVFLKEEAFMNETVEVEILPSDRPDAEQTIQLLHQGVSQMLLRGIATPIKRKFLYVLAQARAEGVRTRETFTPSGDRTMVIDKYNTLRYPFRVTQDKNPNGRAWLEQVMQEAI